MPLVECFRPPSLSYQSSKVDRLSLYTINAIFCSSDDIGALPIFDRVNHISFLWALCRYAFRSTEKVALQEIGPRFTLKLRWLKKGIPAVHDFGEEPQPLILDVPPVPTGERDQEPSESPEELLMEQEEPRTKTVPPKHDEFIWAWKVSITPYFLCSPP